MNKIIDLNDSIQHITNDELFEICKIINTEIFSRQTSKKLDNYFQPNQMLTYCDDDGCLFIGVIAEKDEFHQFGDEGIFIKDVDPKTNKQVFANGPNGQLIPRGNPIMNAAQLFKYVINGESISVL
tara:strand:- start:728 stop:1105 length:378 start_codon:yes stop_codon:yes gene_type:complete